MTLLYCRHNQNNPAIKPLSYYQWLPSCSLHNRCHLPFPLVLNDNKPYVLPTSEETHRPPWPPRVLTPFLRCTHTHSNILPTTQTCCHQHQRKVSRYLALRVRTYAKSLWERRGVSRRSSGRKTAWNCLQTAATHWVDDALDGITKWESGKSRLDEVVFELLAQEISWLLQIDSYVELPLRRDVSGSSSSKKNDRWYNPPRSWGHMWEIPDFSWWRGRSKYVASWLQVLLPQAFPEHGRLYGPRPAHLQHSGKCPAIHPSSPLLPGAFPTLQEL